MFNYPGLGLTIVNAASRKDLPVLQAAVLLVAIIYMLATLVADLVIAWINPRARLGGDACMSRDRRPSSTAVSDIRSATERPSERKQARRERWRLLRRRPGFIIGA